MHLRRTNIYALSVLALMLFSLLLSACGGSGAAPSSNNGPVTVNWWSWNPGDPTYQQFVKAFNASHSDIKLVYKFQQYNDYINNLKLSMASGTGPDIFGTQAGSMQKVYAPFMEDLTPYATKAWGDNWRDRFYSIGLQAVTNGDTTQGLPFFVSGAGYIWYNKAIFDKYNVQPPKTYDEWVAVCKTLSSKGVTPFVQGAKDAWVNYDMYIALANSIAPGKFYDAEAGKIPWTDPDLVKAMDYWRQLFHNGVMQKGALGLSQYPDADDVFNKGQAAMILYGTWENSMMTKQGIANAQSSTGVKADLDILPLAFPSVNANGQRSKLFGGPDVALAMNKQSKNKEAAWKVIQWLTSDEAQKIYAGLLNNPAIKSVTLDQNLVISDEQKAALKTEEQDLNNMIGPREIPYPELQTALADALQNVATDNQTPQQAMAAVQTAFQNIQK
jgi:raffinose/stachyose/melibiose transport system substrate-binding protein